MAQSTYRSHPEEAGLSRDFGLAVFVDLGALSAEASDPFLTRRGPCHDIP